MSTQPDWAYEAAREVDSWFWQAPHAVEFDVNKLAVTIRNHAAPLIRERDELLSRLKMETANHDAAAKALGEARAEVERLRWLAGTWLNEMRSPSAVTRYTVELEMACESNPLKFPGYVRREMPALASGGTESK